MPEGSHHSVKAISLLLAVLLFFSVLFSLNLNVSKAQSANLDFRTALSFVDMNRVMNHVQTFSGMGSRVTGYPGADAAADYIANTFKGYGLDVQIQEYDLPVPVDYGQSQVEILSPTRQVFRAYPLWPNFVQPCASRGLIGRLTYAGFGTLQEVDGKNLTDTIVLMKFDSGNNWIQMANLGAKAAIFIEPSETTRWEAEDKFSTVPVYFPRLYISETDGQFLRELTNSGDVTVNITSTLMYELKKGRNVIGIVKGTEFPDEIIMVTSYYDSWSIVPSLSPGADEATGIASLLELARFLSQNPPRRTFWLVGLSGHWEALAGSREFVEKYYFSEEVQSGKQKIWLLMNLDFSSDVDKVALMYTGTFNRYFGNTFQMYVSWLSPQAWNFYLTEMESQLGYGLRDKTVFNALSPFQGWEFVYEEFMIDSEPAHATRSMAITFRTAYAGRMNRGHPFDLPEKVNLENIKSQLEPSWGVIYAFSREGPLPLKWDLYKPLRVYELGGMRGYLTAEGVVRRYDSSTGWYANIGSNEGVVLVTVVRAQNAYHKFAYMLTTADENGFFRIHGVVSNAAGGSKGAGSERYMFAAGWDLPSYLSAAYVIDPQTSSMIYAPDLGTFGAGTFPVVWIDNDIDPIRVFPVVFKSASFVLFNLIDPGSLDNLAILGMRRSNPITSKSYSVTVYEANTYSTPLSSGREPIAAYPFEGLLMVFVPPNSKYVMTYTTGQAGTVGMLTNSDERYPQGRGFYSGEVGTQTFITLTSFRFIQDLYSVSKSRLDLESSFNLRTFMTELYSGKAFDLLNKAQKAISERKYSEALPYSLVAWSWLIKTYSSSQGLLVETINTTVFFFILLIPFTILSEAFFLTTGGIKKIISLALIFGVVVTVVTRLHPGFSLTAAPIILGGVAIVSVSIPLLFIFFSELSRYLREVRGRMMGEHFAEISRLSAVLMAFSAGIRQMKKRATRSILILLSVTIIIMAMISLTSAVMVFEQRLIKVQGTPTYSGLLISKGLKTPLDNMGYSLAQSTHVLQEGATVSSRIWHYPQVVPDFFAAALFGPEGRWVAQAVLGMEPEEAIITGVEEAVVDGRWLIDEDYLAVIIPKEAQDVLGVNVGDKVLWNGISMTVVGVIDSQIFDSKADLDGNTLVPTRFEYSATGEPLFTRQSSSTTFIIPLNFASRLYNAYISSIAIRMDNNRTTISNAAKYLIIGHPDLDIHISYDNEILASRRGTGFLVQGWQFLLGPLIISCLGVFNMMIGSVTERADEMKVLSTIGLSPTHIFGMYLVESFIYAVVGAVIGYIGGLTTLSLLLAYNMLPSGFYPNFSSNFVLIAVSLTMSAVLIPSIYPLIRGSRKVTPSLERKWRMSTSPKGDLWEIPLPFTFVEEQAEGVIRFLNEYFDHAKEPGVWKFLTQDVKLNYEERTLQASVLLEPIAANVVQKVEIKLSSAQEGKLAVQMILQQLSGLGEVWRSSNVRFVDDLRKQLLIWLGLPKDKKDNYILNTRKETRVSRPAQPTVERREEKIKPVPKDERYKL